MCGDALPTVATTADTENTEVTQGKTWPHAKDARVTIGISEEPNQEASNENKSTTR